MSARTRVLVVDDEPDVVELLVGALRRLGYDADGTTDPERVVEALDRRHCDVVVLDLMMPRLNGIDLLARIRADGRRAGLVAVVLTASRDAGAAIRAISLDASAYLTKPATPTQLAEAIEDALRRQREEVDAYVRRQFGLGMVEVQAILEHVRDTLRAARRELDSYRQQQEPSDGDAATH